MTFKALQHDKPPSFCIAIYKVSEPTLIITSPVIVDNARIDVNNSNAVDGDELREGSSRVDHRY